MGSNHDLDGEKYKSKIKQPKVYDYQTFPFHNNYDSHNLQSNEKNTHCVEKVVLHKDINDSNYMKKKTVNTCMKNEKVGRTSSTVPRIKGRGNSKLSTAAENKWKQQHKKHV